MVFDPGVELGRRRHRGRVEQAHYPRFGPKLGKDVLEHELVGLKRVKTIGVGQQQLAGTMEFERLEATGTA